MKTKKTNEKINIHDSKNKRKILNANKPIQQIKTIRRIDR